MLLVTFFKLFSWFSRVVCCVGGGAVGRGWVGIGALEVALEGGTGVGGDWYGALEVSLEGVSGTDGGTDGGVEYGALEGVVALEGGAGVGGDWYGALEVLLEGGGRAVEGGLGEPGGGLAVGSVMTGGPFL